MYSSYTAASFARKYELARKYGVNFIGAVSWSFEFENQAWYAGFRDLATNGIDKPVLNVFRMFGMMKGDLVTVKSSAPLSADEMCKNSVRRAADINSIASTDNNSVAVMVWNYHDDDLSAPSSDISINVKNMTGRRVLVTHYRIDDQFSNSYEVWKAMGEPQNPSSEQLEILERSGQLQMYSSPVWKDVIVGKITVDFSLPRQGVSLIKLTW